MVLLVTTLYPGIAENIRMALFVVGALTLIATLTATYGRTRS